MAGGAAAVVAATLATPAAAQYGGSVLVDQAIPADFDRGRNVGVLDRPRPDYDQLGIQLPSFILYPSVDASANVTTNAFLAATNTRSDVFLGLMPRLRLQSQWDRDEVVLSAEGALQRFAANPVRNQNGFDLKALGTKQVGADFAITTEGQYGQFYESPNNGAVDAAAAILSPYRQGYVALRGQYTSGRARLTLAYDHLGVTFSPLASGLSQADRDRTVNRVTGEAQFAKTPSFAFYAQATADFTDYSRRLLSGAANRDSRGWRLIGGANFDIPGSIRGRVGLGYVRRNYLSSTYRDAGGLSVEAQVDLFPTELTTVHVSAARVLEDLNIGTTSSFFDNRFTLGADHELLSNLIVSGLLEYRHQTYSDLRQTANLYAVSTEARYLVSRFVSLNGRVYYGSRTVSGGGTGYNEGRFVLGIRVQR